MAEQALHAIACVEPMNGYPIRQPTGSTHRGAGRLCRWAEDRRTSDERLKERTAPNLRLMNEQHATIYAPCPKEFPFTLDLRRS